MIEFNRPPYTGKELDYIKDAVETKKKISGDGYYTKQCNAWLEEEFHVNKALLTTSCTSALEMSALLSDIQPGDEVIAPSYTYVTTVSAFVLRGAKIKYVDIRPDTMNIDESLIEEAITDKTKVIVPVHYAGVSCDMDTINELADKYNLKVVEDAAQGVMAKYKGQYLGTIGDFGTYSFHETKNYSMGEGGALLVNNAAYKERAEIIREKGTDRSKFLRGQVDKYTWVDLGSSYLPSDINAAYLYAQLEQAGEIKNNRLKTWNLYNEGLADLEENKDIELPYIPDEVEHNAHMFYIKARDLEERSELIDHLKSQGIQTTFHYVPLHSSKAGKEYGEFVGEDQYTTKESERLLRLPLYYGIKEDEVQHVIDEIRVFYSN